MRSGSFEGRVPYAPIPTSQRPTRLRFGSWFQKRPRAVQVIASVAIFIGLTYLTWRLIFTLPGANPVLFFILFIAEAFGYLSFLTLVVDAWRIDPTPRLEPLDVSVDIVIPTYDEGREIVEPTIVGALLVRGDTTIYLADDGRREEMRELAAEYGIRYVTRSDNLHAKAGNLNALLPHLTSELLLVLDADHVPSPDFLEATSGYFRRSKIALVQTAHSFRNHNSVMHDEEGRNEQSLFFDVLLPGRNRIGTAFWCGSAALIRTSALREIGGMATRTSTEDFETSLMLQQLGYELKYHNEHLIQGLAPDNLAAYLIQRSRWAEGTLSSFKWGYQLPWSKRLTFVQRFSYTGSLLYYLSPIQRLAYTFNLVIAGAFGIIPVGYAGWWYALFWSAWAICSLTAVTALERGASQPFEGVRNLLVGMGAFLWAIPSLWSNKAPVFNVTPKNQIDLGGWDSVRYLKVAIGIGLVTAAILVVRWLDIALEALTGLSFMPPMNFTGILIITAFGLMEVIIITAVVIKIWRRRQYRRMWRFPVDLPGRINQSPAKCLDLHQEGGAFIVSSDMIETDDLVEISIDCRLFDDSLHTARGQLLPLSILPVTESKTSVRISGVLKWHDDTSQRAVIETCYVTEPYAARHQFWIHRAPRLPVNLKGLINDQETIFFDLSTHGIGCVVNEAVGQVGSRVPICLTLPSNKIVVGTLEIRSQTPLDGQGWRIGGITTWTESQWLTDFVTKRVRKARKIK